MPQEAPAPEFCLVMTTTSSEEEAATLARQIVQARLGACVQLQAIRSFYEWKNAPCESREYLLLIKTRAAQYPPLEDFIRAHHSYETPEVVRLPITAGSMDYLRWVAAQTGA